MAPTTERPAGLWLTEGVELLGEYQGSGLTEPPYLVRRGDGHTIQVSRLVYLVAEALQSHHFPEEIARAVTTSFGREVSVENILFLVETKLGPVGLVPADDPDTTTAVTANPLLALRLRLPLVPERVHRIVSTILTPLFWPPVVATVLAVFVVVDVWLFTSQGGQLLDSLQTIIYQPQLLLVLTALTIAAGVFHEVGHATAARYGGANPGAMGAGVYIVWPVFYTDVSDTYRLSRRGRLRTDLGGVYFNVLATLLAIAVSVTTGFGPLLILAVVLQIETLRQFLPFVRLDGYYVMSDLAGVPNLFAYMKPVLTVLLRRGDSDTLRFARHKLGELTTKARVLIIGWVVVTAPVLALNLVLFLVLIPRLAGAAWGSAGLQVDAMTGSSGAISPVGVANGMLGMVMLTLPVLGMTYLLGTILLRLGRFAAGKWSERPALTGAASGTAVAALVLHVGLAWPSGFVSALSDARDVPSSAGADPLGVALGGDLPPGLTGLTRTAPPAEPVTEADDDGDFLQLADPGGSGATGGTASSLVPADDLAAAPTAGAIPPRPTPSTEPTSESTDGSAQASSGEPATEPASGSPATTAPSGDRPGEGASGEDAASTTDPSVTTFGAEPGGPIDDRAGSSTGSDPGPTAGNGQGSVLNQALSGVLGFLVPTSE